MVLASFTSITLGHKLARWASAFKRDLDRIQAMKSRDVLTAQLGGAVGSLASLQDQRFACGQRICEATESDCTNKCMAW